MNRRQFLASATTLTAAGALAACAINTTNGVTTITINVAQINAWFTALNNSVKLITALTGIGATPAGIAIAAIGATISTDLAAFNTATKGQTTLTFNSTSIPAAVQSLETDADSLLTNAKTALSGVASVDVATAQTYLSAVETIVSLFQAELGSLTAAATLGAAPKMTEAQALAALTPKH